MASDPNTLINAARCVDSCIPEGMMAAVAIEIQDQHQQQAIRGEGAGEFILGEGGEFIMEE